MQSVVIADTNQHVLLDLVRVADPNLPKIAQAVTIQLDNGAAGAKLSIGNPGITAPTNCGAKIVASQAFSIPSLSSNLIQLSDVALQSDTPSVQVNITIITR